jgi:hypothetical protein
MTTPRKVASGRIIACKRLARAGTRSNCVSVFNQRKGLAAEATRPLVSPPPPGNTTAPRGLDVRPSPAAQTYAFGGPLSTGAYGQLSSTAASFTLQSHFMVDFDLSGRAGRFSRDPEYRLAQLAAPEHRRGRVTVVTRPLLGVRFVTVSGANLVQRQAAAVHCRSNPEEQDGCQPPCRSRTRRKSPPHPSPSPKGERRVRVGEQQQTHRVMLLRPESHTPLGGRVRIPRVFRDRFQV